MRRRGAGFSLVELLVASTVSLTALAAVFSIFFPARTFFQQANETSAMYSDAMTALDRLTVEIEESGPWVVDDTDANPAVLALPSARDGENRFRRKADGTPDWRKWILYYVYADARGLLLLRREVPGTFPPVPEPYRIDPGLLVAPGAGARVACRNLSLFRISSSPAPGGGTTCSIELVLSQETRRPGTAPGPVTHTARFERTAVTRNPE